jgi:predicted RNase H-like HicB family nuclease
LEVYYETGGLGIMAIAMKYLAIIEREGTAFGAWVPDLPGCVSVGDSVAEVEELIRGAIAFHIEGLREGGFPVPEPTTSALEVAV